MSTKPLQFQIGLVECVKPDYAGIRPIVIEVDSGQAPVTPAFDDKLDLIQAEALAVDEVASYQDTDSLLVLARDLHWPSFNGGRLRLLPLTHREARRLMDALRVGETVLYLHPTHAKPCPIWLPQSLMVAAKSLLDECERVAYAESEQRRLDGLMFDLTEADM